MSFRYTNNLIGVVKHRLAVESAHRDIARRTFTGTCNGVEVTCSGYGSVLAIRLIDKETWEPFYAKRSLSSSPSVSAEQDAEVVKAAPPAPAAGLDLHKLSRSIQSAVWEANRLIRAAKEEAHARAVLYNPQGRSHGTLRDWYEVDATAMHPRPFDGLKQEAATPWMQAVRFAKANATSYLTGKASGATGGGAAPSISVLAAADCDPLAIPVGATHPLYTPALAQLEDLDDASTRRPTTAATAAVTGVPTLSRVNAHAVLSEQRKEMSRDEQAFWERVELIRRGQLASIPNGANKRGYTEMAAVVVDSVQDKVELKFTQ